MLDLEEKFLRSLQVAPSRVHNVLRNVGNFPLIITTNMDELLERFLWKTGNRGETIRLDQVSRCFRVRGRCNIFAVCLLKTVSPLARMENVPRGSFSLVDFLKF